MASLVLSIGLTSFLNLREELIVPSWPAESITTDMALAFCVVTPRMLSIKQLSLTFAPERPVPMQMTLLADVTKSPAERPTPILAVPVLLMRAPNPTAVLLLPVMLFWSANAPLGVLKPPRVL